MRMDLTNAQDLYNYQMALQEIDNMRKNGKFVDNEGNVPEGQLVRASFASSLSMESLALRERDAYFDDSSQVLLYLLRRCYGLCYRLMASSEPISEELMPIANVSLPCVISCVQMLSEADAIVVLHDCRNSRPSSVA